MDLCIYCREKPRNTGYDRCFDCRTWRDEGWCEANGHGALAGSEEAQRFALEWGRRDLERRILDEISLVDLVASFDPDESGYGQPHAYDEPFRGLIREAQELVQKESEDL